MKNIFKTLLASTLGMMALVSCDRTDDLAVIEYKDVPSLDASSFSSSSYVVTESNLASTFETIMFKKPVYTQNTAIESQIEIALAGTNFASPVNLGSTTENSYVRLLYRQLNEAVLALIDKDTYTAGTPVEIEVRVKSSIKTRTGSLLNPVYSSPVLIAVTPMSLEIQYTDLYLIGDATAAGWVNTATNANMYPLLKDATSNKAYTYTGYFAKGEFKMVETKGAWSPQYGFDSDGKLSTDGGSGNIPVAEAGYYKLTVDTAKLTYTLEKIDTPSTTYSTMEIIGEGIGSWNDGIKMTQSTFDSSVWYAENVVFTAKEYKFRTDNTWTHNWGTKTDALFGTLTKGDSNNITMKKAGTYNVYFNSHTGEYTLIAK